MVYTGQVKQTEFVGGKNILASEHLQFIEAAGTLDATAFATGIVPIGQLVARDLATGKYVPFEETFTAETHDNFSITNVDFDNDGENDAIIGELIVRGSVYEAKLAVEVPAAFKEANPQIRYVSHV